MPPELPNFERGPLCRRTTFCQLDCIFARRALDNHEATNDLSGTRKWAFFDDCTPIGYANAGSVEVWAHATTVLPPIGCDKRGLKRVHSSDRVPLFLICP